MYTLFFLDIGMKHSLLQGKKAIIRDSLLQ